MSLLALVFLLLLCFIFLNHFRSSSSSSRRANPLPPGPKPWPIIGNIPHFATKNPHISTAQFAKTYGPLISFKLGTQVLVVGSSPEAAMEILRTHDRFLSGRHLTKALPFKKEVIDKIGLVWASNCSDHWKSLKALCRTELFSPKAIESQAAMRERKVSDMIEFIKNNEGQAVGIAEVVFITVFNMISTLLFSKNLLEFEDEGEDGGLKSTVWRMLEMGFTPNVADLYPVLAPLDPQGLRREVSKLTRKVYSVWESDVRERRERRRAVHEAKNDLLDVFIENGFGNDVINWLFLELFTAGTDTSATTVQWAMAELVKNKEAMERVTEEINVHFKAQPVNESQVSQLPFLNACIKEALRLHPPVPFLIPHRAVQDCSVLGYTIPKNSQVLVNLWAIGRDPSVWDDSLSFKPERFLGSNLDFKGQDFRLLPFGSGRRICPGLPMAQKQVGLILASLLYYFDWSLLNGRELKMEEKLGITLHMEQPLLLVPKIKVLV